MCNLSFFVTQSDIVSMNKEEKTSLINSKMENDSIISQLREVANTRRVAMTLPLYAAFFCVVSYLGQ